MTTSCTIIEKDIYKFAICDAPSATTLRDRVAEFKKLGVKHCVRVCNDTYDKRYIESQGIAFHDWPFDDGHAPPEQIIRKWLDLVSEAFPPGNSSKDNIIAIHCVAGLGRAPLLVCLALIEKCNMSALDAVKFVRDRRRGAINHVQLEFLEKYSKKKEKCAIM